MFSYKTATNRLDSLLTYCKDHISDYHPLKLQCNLHLITATIALLSENLIRSGDHIVQVIVTM